MLNRAKCEICSATFADGELLHLHYQARHRASGDPIRGRTQFERVIDAIETAGATSSAEASELTGLPVKTCSAYISILRREGFIEDHPGVTHKAPQYLSFRLAQK
jgi:hypothetical protein